MIRRAILPWLPRLVFVLALASPALAAASGLSGEQALSNDQPLSVLIIVGSRSSVDNQLGNIIGALSAQNLDVQVSVDDALEGGVVIILIEGPLDLSEFVNAIPPEHLVLFFGTGGTEDTPSSVVVVVLGPPHSGPHPAPNDR